MRPSKAFAVITFLTLLSSFSIALSPTNASEDHSQHLTKLAVPNGVVTVPDSTSTVLRFSAIPNATSYKVRVYAAKGENPLRTIAPFNSGESISALTPNSTYKITVQAIGNGVRYSNSEESRKVSVTTLSALAVPAFSLNPTVMTATVGQLFNSPTPVSIGGAIANFSIDAGIFPINGLSFNTSTGVISGTPITAWIPNTYTITAHNSSGVALQSFTLITQAAPTVPNVSGLIRSAANASLIASGFVAGAVTTTTSGATSLNDGHVQSQSPTAGSALAAGGSVAFVLYTYVAPISTPTVTSISPISGTTAGGKAVTITGTGFTLTITSVTIGGVAATSVVRVSATSITAVTPAHVAGAVDVVVTNSDTGVGTGTGLYAYVAPLVPDLTALLEGAATSALTTNGFVTGAVTTTTSGANPGNNGLVQSQTPTAGSTLTAGGSVDLVRYAYVAPLVPNVSGLTQADAEASLITNGFILGSVTTTTSGANPGNNGLVQSQTPTAGSTLTAGGSVDLVLYAALHGVVPTIVGAPTGTAYKYLGANFAIGISTGTTTVGANWLNDGKIATQSLSGDQFYGSIIDYTTYAAPRGVVPTIVGLSIADAITALGANFVLDIPAISGAPQSSSPVGATALNDGKIEWQSLTGNIPYGSVIDYWVYFYIAPAAPVVTAAGAPSLGGTATATDINLDGIWDLIATPAVGYTFTSWGCDASQIPASTSTATTTVTPSANTTCIATFTAATTYSVTYYGNVNDSTVPLAMDGPYIEAADVTVMDSSGLGLFRTGYSFAGWNTQADGRGAPTPQPGYPTFPMPAANVELYAQWVNNTFNIRWSDNGGAGTSGGDSTYIGGSQITGFPTMLPTYSGFKFIGWNTSSDGLGTDVSSGYMPRIIWPNSYSDITLYAKWANNTFNITWDQNFNPNTQGHWPSSGDSTYVGGSAVVMPMQPVQDGYAFAAWQASDSSTSVSFSYVPIAPFGDITFTAVWTAIDISVDPILDAGPMNPWTYWDGGQSLTLTGSGFIAGTTVTIGGSNASITSLTDTSITVLTPIANDPGHMTVVVTSPNGSSASTTYFYQIT